MVWFLSTCSHLATGLLVTLSRGVTLKRKSWTRKALPQKVPALLYCVRVCTVWSLGPCSPFANQKTYVLPGCNCMSVWIHKCDFFIFLRSHLSCYQFGSNLVDQWKLWRYTDLFFSGIDNPVLQDPQLRLRVWLTEGCEISKGNKGEKSKNPVSPVLQLWVQSVVNNNSLTGHSDSF